MDITDEEPGLLRENASLRQEIATVMSKAATLEEGLSQVNAMLQREDRHWTKLAGVDEDEGLGLDELKEWSNKIRNSVIGAPWMKRGLGLRATYIWQGGIKYDGISTESRGRGANTQGKIDHPANQRAFYGVQARRRREGCLYHDGIALWFGDDKTKLLEAIPLNEITGDIRDPDHQDIIWAYRHSWVSKDLINGIPKNKVEWVFVDAFIDKRVDNIMHGGISEPVNRQKTAFDMHANSMQGFAYGSPDALAAIIWNGIARDAYMDAVTMTAAMATFAFKASVSTQGGADNASMKLAKPGGAGQTAVLGATNDLTPMSNAGRAYDFNALRGLTAIIATALDVSNIALTSDPGAAGSSYGSASTLDLPSRLAMEARRFEHIDLDVRVLKWMDPKSAPTAFFDSLDDASDIFRELQAILLLWSSGMYNPEPLEKRASELMGIIGNKIPAGIMIPNNSDYPDTLSNDDQAAADAQAKAQTSSVGKPNATPAGQGQNSAAGKGVGSNDLRTDQLANMLQTLNAFIASEDAIRAQREAA